MPRISSQVDGGRYLGLIGLSAYAAQYRVARPFGVTSFARLPRRASDDLQPGDLFMAQAGLSGVANHNQATRVCVPCP